MNTHITNLYDDQTRADAYAGLEFPGTYYLAFRDLPAIIAEHVRGTRALDFGCGAGRSTRFIRNLGFETAGVDISSQMIAQAHELDPNGDYQLIGDGDLDDYPAGSYDLVSCIFPFDNIATKGKKVAIFRSLKRLLKDEGCMVNLVSSPEIYLNEWLSFSTKDYPENRAAQSGDTVRIVMLDVPDRRPVEDIIWTDEAYRDVYREADLDLIQTYRPLGDEAEPYHWVSETTIAPWVIYVLGHAQ